MKENFNLNLTRINNEKKVFNITEYSIRFGQFSLLFIGKYEEKSGTGKQLSSAKPARDKAEESCVNKKGAEKDVCMAAASKSFHKTVEECVKASK